MDNLIYEVCESTCHECSTTDEVENDKKNVVLFRKSNLILKKDMEHREITREKKLKKKIKLEVHSMKESSERQWNLVLSLG